ncbi:hypothetical protein J6TS7_20960 [Paenibacillus dendritiformis]|uniref:hypothetical protein n=1 Tax=Paenibacillus TaxID=44249 RepID=UPI001B072CCD|nr:hypothetical protein [Paenibacillus dendritiformis]GIO78486.1 hypothetical protein J6TS7_20960 [Paenibacillus dendritiformis]
MNEYLKKIFGDRIEQVDTLANESITPEDIVNLVVEREAIDRGHLQAYLREFDRIQKKKGAMRSRIIISYHGYDFEPREVYQIPEIRKWTCRLLQNIPHLFYFISPQAHSIRVIFMCVAEVVGRQGEQAVITKDSARRTIEKIVRDAVAHSKKVGDSISEQFALANRIMEATGYERTL